MNHCGFGKVTDFGLTTRLHFARPHRSSQIW